jgi:hypothetical protein
VVHDDHLYRLASESVSGIGEEGKDGGFVCEVGLDRLEVVRILGEEGGKGGEGGVVVCCDLCALFYLFDQYIRLQDAGEGCAYRGRFG